MRDFDFFKTFFLDPFITLFYFPAWWYSRGLKNFLFFLKKTINETASPFVLKILIQNLVKPMYGDYSREGKIISFFMRTIHLSWRIFRVAFVCLISFVALVVYLFLLPFIFYRIICFFDNSCYYFLFPPIL